MPIKPLQYAGIALTAFIISACSNIGSTGNDTSVASSKNSTLIDKKTDTGALEDYYCLTFGYKNWLLESDGQTITLSGQASMPTPAWSIVLHHDDKADNNTIELAMETIEPSGLSSSVISWVDFEKTVKATATTNIVVTCAGNIVWNSLDS